MTITVDRRTTAALASITRREFVGMAAAAGLLAACGNDSGGSARATSEDAPRTVRTDSGAVEVPADPERVVAAIGSSETDMVAVGVMPVLTTTFAGPWVDLDDSVTITENIPPTAEELLAVRPDLVVGWSWVTQEPSFDEIREVAPYVGLGETAATAGPGFDGSQPMRSWDRLFLSVADAVGRRARGDELVAELEQRLDDLAERRQGRPEVSVVRIELYQPGTFSYRGQNEDTAELMRRIGLTVVGPDETIREESLERLPEIDADWLVIPVGNDNIPRSLYDEVSATPLFQSIPAVKAGRVHPPAETPQGASMSLPPLRRIALVPVVAALAALAAACGSDSTPTASPVTEQAAAGGDTFPVIIEHAFGTTEIPDEPERVVTWGWGSTDAAIALGVVPVAMPHMAYGGDEQGVLPWVRERLEADGAGIPEVLPDAQEPPIEAIAAARPDLILAVYSGITDAEYELLSEIAPTVAYPDQPWATPWRETIEIVGSALGRSDRAAEVLADIDQQVAEAAEAHPELDGKTVIQVVDTPDTFYVYKEADPRVQFLTDLGFVNAPAVTELATDESTFYFTLSKERLGELESDVLVAHAETQEQMDAFLGSDYARQLEQVDRGSVAALVGASFVASVSPPTALSLTWGLVGYVEILAEAAAAAEQE